MATCPHCGDPGAPNRGWCLVCGFRVDSAAAQASAPAGGAGAPPAHVAPQAPRPATETISFDDLDQVAGAVQSSDLPSLRPLDESPTTVAPIALPPHAADPEAAPAEPPAGADSDAHESLGDALERDAHATLALHAKYEVSSVSGDDPPLLGVLVELEASGTPLRRAGAGPVAHVVLALDVSASMNVADKFPVLREAVAGMLDELRAPGAAAVLVSVVIFAKGAAVVLRDRPATQLRAGPLFDAIVRHPICFTRYTDVAGALDRAGRIAWEQSQAARTLPIRIYLLTDGKPQDLARAREAAERCGKVTCDLHALAFGADADVRVLQDLFAGRRGGTVKSVRRGTIGDAFERIAEVAQRVVATRCRVQADLAPGVVGGAAFRYRPARVRFPDPAFAGGKRFSADLGTIETDRPYSLLLEVRPPETSDPVSDLGTVTVRIPGYGGPIETSIRLIVPRTPPGAPPGEPDREVRAARDILDALDDSDPHAALRALRLRRTLYEHERRDPGLLAILDHAIGLLERTGSLAALSPGEHATLLAHTCTSGARDGADSAARVSPAGRTAPPRGSGGARRPR